MQTRGVVLACGLRYHWRAKPHTSDVISPLRFNMLAKPNHDHVLKIVVAVYCLSTQKPRINHRVQQNECCALLPYGPLGIFPFRHF
jgi:hypothetical protein